MTPYTVLWRQTATNQLTEIWLAASDRARINEAVQAIDGLLAINPLGRLTRELSEGLRTITVLPLRVIYAIEEQDCIVDVATVRCIE